MGRWTRREVLRAGLAAGGTVLLRDGFAQSATALVRAPRRALVIGNGAYTGAILSNPRNDAKAIGEELKRAGFEVTTALDLDRAHMKQVIDAYGATLARDKAVGVFYFAGHGLQLAWRNYLVPIDARVGSIEDVKARCIDLGGLLEDIARASNPMNVIILDACRDNPFGRDFRVEQKGLSQLDAPPGTLLAYATSPGHVASDGAGANGLYTEHLLREIKVPDTKIEDVFKRVRLAVRRSSNGLQIPWESTSLEEDFWFIPPKEIKQLAEEERQREFKQQLALWEKLQEEQRTALAEAERERKRKQEAEREQARLAEQGRREEAERQRKAREEAARAEREKADAAARLAEQYLRVYPSGYFSELAQLDLDNALAALGEKPIQIASAEGNPYSKGSARADLGFKLGDSYTYRQLDRDSGQQRRRFTNTVVNITDTEVIFDRNLVLDRLGNLVGHPDGRRFTPRQDQPLEYAVGKKWKTRFEIRNRQNVQAFTEMEFKITGREKITVPAGTFNCYVIEGEGTSSNEKAVWFKVSWKRWMAPDKVRVAVASETFRKVSGFIPGHHGFGKMEKTDPVRENERLELLTYKQT